jgi:hypothetical protein
MLLKPDLARGSDVSYVVGCMVRTISGTLTHWFAGMGKSVVMSLSMVSTRITHKYYTYFASIL